MKITKAQLKQIIKEEITNYYHVLKVNDSLPTGDTGMIKKAYRSQAMANHPDRGGDSKKMKMVNNAKDVLLNPDNKKKYDQELYKDTIDCKDSRPEAAFCPRTGIPLDDKFIDQFADLAGIAPDNTPEAAFAEFENTRALKDAILAGITNRFMAAMKANNMEAMKGFQRAYDEASKANDIAELEGFKTFLKWNKET